MNASTAKGSLVAAGYVRRRPARVGAGCASKPLRWRCRVSTGSTLGIAGSPGFDRLNPRYRARRFGSDQPRMTWIAASGVFTRKLNDSSR
jgi:hypothetical protein